jgi:ribonuclease VapC
LRSGGWKHRLARPGGSSTVRAATVLDASALLALFNDEPGAQAVLDALAGHCLVSAVNQTEVLTKRLDKGLSEAEAASVMAAVEIEVLAFDAGQSLEAARLRRETRALGLSLADRACLALARSRKAVALTADRPWSQVADAVGVTLRCIR